MVPLRRQSDDPQSAALWRSPNDILIVNTQGNVNNSGFGELLASSAAKAGVRGVIVDGTVRDAEALEALALPVYARGLSPNGCNKDGPGEVGAIVACGGVAVRPGDIDHRRSRRSHRGSAGEDAVEVSKLAAAQVDREEQRKGEIEKGVLVRPEIDEALRRLKVID